MSKNKLGRGFDSLFPKNFDESILEEKESIIKVPLEKLMANPDQPRIVFNNEDLEELASSIKQHGLIQPIIITPNGQKYYIVAGERRYRASKRAGLKSISAIVRTSEHLQRLELALVENVQRVNLSPIEQATSINYLHQQFSMDYETIAKKLGKSSATVINSVRLLGLPKVIIEALNNKKITEGHARAILGIKNTAKQVELMKLILKNGWSVRQTERYVVAHKQGAVKTSSAIKKSSSNTKQTEALTRVLNTQVSLKRMARGGKIEIVYKDDDDLNRIIKYISKV